ncbi:hypothetical protein FRC17_000205 [Serendipita sp. 399]|nr:hypothetical protein FRC17_000205 [Serendipita sp. 399]
MPREVTLHQGIISLSETPSKPQPDEVATRDDNLRRTEDPLEPPNSANVPPSTKGLSHAKANRAKSSALKYDPSEIIDITSSSSEDDTPATTSPLKNKGAYPHNKLISQSKSTSVPPSKIQSPSAPRSPTKAKRRYVIYSSSEGEEEPNRNQSEDKGKYNAKPAGEATTSSNRLVFPVAANIKIGQDGLIEYVPTPRKPKLFSPSKQTSPAKGSLNQNDQGSELKRAALDPDIIPEYIEDLSWEVEKSDSGGVRTQATVIRRKSNVNDPEPPVRLEELGEMEAEEIPPNEVSPTKTPRPKKMPETVAALHRIAIPYLKQLDAKVFGNQLGASHLPDLEAPPASPTKKKRGDQIGVIYGMGARGEYNDGNGSYIELVWSNRMATTAGRTDYKKTPQRQVTIKIELGVKVVTTEERLKNTLAHEACHAATWAINGDFTKPHGATFKRWATKVMKAFPDVEVTTRHDYEIQYKYTWKCVRPSCGQIYQRHSNSIDIEKQGCHCSSRLQPQFSLPQKRTRNGKVDGSPTKSAPDESKVVSETVSLAERIGDVDLSDGDQPADGLVDDLIFELKLRLRMRRLVPVDAQRLDFATSPPLHMADEEDFEFDVLKGIRIFFSTEKKTLEPWYLTSWVGWPESADEWLGPHMFSGGTHQVDTLESIVPRSFNRKKFGEEWFPPKEWIDEQLRDYYKENPHNVSKWVLAKELTEDELHTPVTLMRVTQVEKNIEDYRQHMARSNKFVDTSQVKTKKLKKDALPKRTKEARKFSGRDIMEKRLAEKKAGVKQPSVRGMVEVGIKYSNQDIQLKKQGTKPSDHGRPRQDDAIQKATSVPATKPRTKSKKVVESLSDSTGDSPQAVAMELDGDDLFTDPESSDEQTLATQAKAVSTKGLESTTKRLIRSPSKASITSSSGSDVPLSQLKAAIISQRSSKPVPSSVIATAPSKPENRSGGQQSVPIGRHPKAPQPKSSGKSTTLVTGALPSSSKDKRQDSMDLQRQNLAQKDSARDPNPAGTPPVVQMDMDPPLFLDEDRTQSPTNMDFTEEANALIQEATKPLAMPEKLDDAAWKPADFNICSSKGSQTLCKVRLMRVTSAQPPNLKWIHQKGFEIKSWRSLSQLEILLLVFKPWQHAIVATVDPSDNGCLTAFTKFLSDHGLFALADTDYPEAKLCFYASDQSFALNQLGVAPSSELRMGLLHLLVSVIKSDMPQQPTSTSSSFAIKSLSGVNPETYYLLPAGSFRPAVVRGARILRFPKDLTIVFKRRKDGVRGTHYSLCTAESLGFRFPDGFRFPKDVHYIDEVTPEEHAPHIYSRTDGEVLKHTINHLDETQALIEIMKKLGIPSKKPISGDANIVFIHNESWEMLKHFKGLGNRKSRPEVWFYAYGPCHALDPSLWGIREIFKRGGILTFTSSAISEDPVGFRYVLKRITDSETWMACISPLVIAMLQLKAIAFPNEEKPISALTYALEAIRQGNLIMTSTPPHPWKLDEWQAWLAAMSSPFLETLTQKPYEADEAILDSAEEALNMFSNPVPPQSPDCSCAKERLRPGWETQSAAPKVRSGTELEETIDAQVFEDLRQWMLIPVVHTEYRQFVVARNRNIGSGQRPPFFESRMKDSVGRAKA